MSSTLIRRATDADFVTLMCLAIMMHRESPVYGKLPLDVKKLEMLGWASITTPDKYAVFVAERDDEIIGMMGAVAVEEFFGPAITTCDLFLYVTPEKRGSLVALRMIREYEKWAESVNAVRINLGVTTGIYVQETCKLFEAAGYSHSGHQYTKVNKHG